MIHVPTNDGRWVSEDFTRLAEVIQDYDASLELRWIPPEIRVSREDRTKPYAIWDTKNDVLVTTASELDTPVAILEKLFDIDNRNGDVLRRLDAHNAAVKAIEMKKYLDEAEAAKDFSAFVIRNKKNYWKHDGQKYDAEFNRVGD